MELRKAHHFYLVILLLISGIILLVVGLAIKTDYCEQTTIADSSVDLSNFKDRYEAYNLKMKFQNIVLSIFIMLLSLIPWWRYKSYPSYFDFLVQWKKKYVIENVTDVYIRFDLKKIIVNGWSALIYFTLADIFTMLIFADIYSPHDLRIENINYYNFVNYVNECSGLKAGKWFKVVLIFISGLLFLMVVISLLNIYNAYQTMKVNIAKASVNRAQANQLHAVNLIELDNINHSDGGTEADVYHAYQILKRNEIPDENIIVMATDDIAYNKNNPTPGVIINYPQGPDVYRGVPKDYTGKDVTSQNFLNILAGNKTAMRGIGSGKVIDSGSDDIVFVNFVGHGTQGILMFPNDPLFADEFIDNVTKMKEQHKFSKMIVYVEACFAGSLFDNMLPDNMNIFVMTAADPKEPSAGCFEDTTRQTWLSNVFSTLWMNHTEHESSYEDSLHHTYERVRSYTNTSHPQEYGDLGIGKTKLRHVLGRRKIVSGSLTASEPPFPTNVANSMDIPLLILRNQKDAATDPEKRRQLKLKYNNLIKGRESIDNLFRRIMSKVADDVDSKQEELRTTKSSLNKSNFQCYKGLYNTFSNSCMSPIQNPYSRSHFQKFVNMCTVNWLSLEKALNDITTVCRESFGLAKPKHIM